MYFYGVVEANIPCTEIQKLEMDYEETDEKMHKDKTRIAVYFRDTTYKEIRQTRAYTAITLFGNIGGFIGVFLGYAIIQIPGFLESILSYIKNYYIVVKSRNLDTVGYHKKLPKV